MRIEEIMSKSIVTVEMDDSLKVVKEIFDHVQFHHLLVVENSKLIGVISDRDLLKAISPNIGTLAETTKDLATLRKRAHQILTRKPVTLSARASINEAIEIFNTHDISCIPIIDSGSRPIGIITWRDIIKKLHQSLKHS